MTPRPLATLVALLAAAATAAGCAPQTSSSSNSTSRFRGDQRLAAQTVEDLEAAASDGDYAKICRDLLARALAERLAQAGRGCDTAVEDAVKDADSSDMTVQSVRVDGDRAAARVKLETGKKDRAATLQLVREGRRWRIAGL
jgi:hypothetical protein